MTSIPVGHAMERLARFQYAIVGDYWEWSLAQTGLALAVKSPIEYLAWQIKCGARFGGCLRRHAAELTMAEASEVPSASAIMGTVATVEALAVGIENLAVPAARPPAAKVSAEAATPPLAIQGLELKVAKQSSSAKRQRPVTKTAARPRRI